MNYIITYTSNSLSHNGIKGQKWGVRNGPPYPLNNSDRSASEKKQNLKSFSELQKDFPAATGYGFNYESRKKFKDLVAQKSGDFFKDSSVSEAFAKQMEVIKKENEEYQKVKAVERDAIERFRDKQTSDTEIKDAQDKQFEYYRKFVDNYIQENSNQAVSSLLKKYSDKKYREYRDKIIWEAYKKVNEDDKYKELSDKANKINGEKSTKYALEVFGAEKLPDSVYAKNSKKAYQKYEKEVYELLGIILTDIGYEDTPEARKYINKEFLWY